MRKKWKLPAVLMASVLGFSLVNPLPYMQEVKQVEAANGANKNANAHDYYTDWAQIPTSYLYDNGDGTVTRVENLYDNLGDYAEGIGNHIIVETYRDGTKLSSKQISKELARYGGFYHGETYNYLIFGQNNPNENDQQEVIRIVKYSHNWERLGAVSVYGSDVWKPFMAASMDCTEVDGKLILHTAYEGYNGAPNSGKVHHQQNMTLVVDISSMKVLENTATYGYDAGSVGHSMNQMVKTDGNRLITVDHGDGGWHRSIVMMAYPNLSVNSDTMIPSIDLLSFGGGDGENRTGAQLGGFEISSSRYLVAGTSIDQSKFDSARQENVFLITTTKNVWNTGNGSITAGNWEATEQPKVTWLTNYSEGSDVRVGNPYLVKINENRFMILWTENRSTVKYCVLDGNGNRITEIKSFSGELSDCEPIVTGSKVLWYVTEDYVPQFYSISIDGNTVTQPFVGISLNASLVTLNQGETEQLSLKYLPSKPANVPAPAWSSSNTKVATVDQNGKIQAVGGGNTTITVKVGDKTATCEVRVSAPVTVPLQSISLNKTAVTLNPGASETLNVSYNPSNTTDSKTVKWTSSNTKVATVSNGKIQAVKSGTATITATVGNKTASCKVTVNKVDEEKKEAGVQYRTHVQTIGWQDWKENGALSGTTGQSKRLEAIYIELKDADYSGGIEYQTHIQDIGWQGWKSNGEMAGTTGQSRQMEAVQIKLTGKMAEKYDIYYRAHVQTYGWLGWTKNGAKAGTEGLSKRMEGIQIQLVPKGGAAPGSTSSSFKEKAKPQNIVYQAHMQTYCWLGEVMNGATGGVTGQYKRMEALKIKIQNPKYSGGVQYRAHLQDTGWQGWKSNGEMAGTTGQYRRMEAVQIKLTGKMAEKYDIYYRAHVQTYGWLGWTKNGAKAGTEGMSKRMEGIQIVLVEKGGKAPGSTSNTFKMKK